MLSKEQIDEIKKLSTELEEISDDREGAEGTIKILKELQTHQHLTVNFSSNGERVDIDVDVSREAVADLLQSIIKDERNTIEDHFNPAIKDRVEKIDTIINGGRTTNF